tara:strand:- start:178 stop:456 length:279 start_codon:yes stop_codon:yes gene_type:complete
MSKSVEFKREEQEEFFPENLMNNPSAHSLEGSLWLDSDDEIHMFVQVGCAVWCMVGLFTGNRNVNSAYGLTDLYKFYDFKRFYGEVTIKHTK